MEQHTVLQSIGLLLFLSRGQCLLLPSFRVWLVCFGVQAILHRGSSVFQCVLEMKLIVRLMGIHVRKIFQEVQLCSHSYMVNIMPFH